MNFAQKDFSTSDLNWARDQIKQYRQVYPKYEKCSKILFDILVATVKRIAPESIVQTRPKSIASFGEKIWCQKENYRDPVNQFSDLCGGRVITHTQNEVDALCDFIINSFDVDQKNSGDMCQKLKPSQFEYRAFHYIVKFKPGVFPTTNVKIPRDLLGLTMELQVKTLLAHAWSDFAHDRTYKSSGFQIPRNYERALDAVSAILESADHVLSSIHKGMQEYASSYDKYMEKDKIRQEIKKLEVILEFDAENLEIAHRIGKLARNIEDWDKVITTLSRFASSGYLPILRELGIALCKANKSHPDSHEYSLGQEYLQKSIDPLNEDPEVLCSLAGTWKGIDDAKAKELYYKAFELEPSNSYALENILSYDFPNTSDLSSFRIAKPTIEAAIRKCQEQIKVGMNLPWAYFDMGKLNLILGKTNESFFAYVKAIQLHPAKWMIETALEGLKKNKGQSTSKIIGYNLILQFLSLGLLLRCEDQKERNQAIKCVKECLPNLNKVTGPIIILTGGCNENAEIIIQQYRQILQKVFKDFTGTIISGGTTFGISGLAADLARENSKGIQTIGYVPKILPDKVSIDKRYVKIHQTDSDSFSLLEPLQYWADIITSGIEPSRIKVLGINGGKIAAAEYRIALAFGAKVAVIENSGGATSELTVDPDWMNSQELAIIPAEKSILQSFFNNPKLPDGVKNKR